MSAFLAPVELSPPTFDGRRSEIFARLRTRVMYCFTSKYAL
jgi:hypothetical protein